jgi:hypothetical protein
MEATLREQLKEATEQICTGCLADDCENCEFREEENKND